MEKGQEKSRRKAQKEEEEEEEDANSRIWDCGSALYDSYEVESFQRHLNAAIASSRSMSMPHLEERRAPSLTRLPWSPSPSKSKITRSFQKLLKVVFRKKRNSYETVVGEQGWDVNGPGADQRGRGLPQMRELGESGADDSPGIMPEFDLKVKVWKSASERFEGDGVAVSCV